MQPTYNEPHENKKSGLNVFAYGFIKAAAAWTAFTGLAIMGAKAMGFAPKSTTKQALKEYFTQSDFWSNSALIGTVFGLVDIVKSRQETAADDRTKLSRDIAYIKNELQSLNREKSEPITQDKPTSHADKIGHPSASHAEQIHHDVAASTPER